MDDEVWRPVAGREGHYSVSSLGRIRSEPRVITMRDGRSRRLRGGVRRLTLDDTGHPKVGLPGPRGSETVVVHRLVLEAFVGPCPIGREGCHRDGVPDNNAVSNLYWGTRSENVLDLVAHQRHHYRRRTACGQRHPFTDANTRINKDGSRSCRRCQRERAAARALADRERTTP